MYTKTEEIMVLPWVLSTVDGSNALQQNVCNFLCIDSTTMEKLRNAEKMFLWGDIERFFLSTGLALAYFFKLINISF